MRPTGSEDFTPLRLWDPTRQPARAHGGPQARRGLAAGRADVGRSLARDPRGVRERFEEELRLALRARAVLVREDAPTAMPPPPNVIGIGIPLASTDTRVRLEAVFDAPTTIDEWMSGMMEAASHVAAILIELERAGIHRHQFPAKRQADGAAPLIGSSDAIRRVRDRIERVAATDFTVLIEGAIGPETHPIFIEVSG